LARAHPAVLKVAAIPVPDERHGEKVCIAVVLRPVARTG
jgi:acyl-CoA synthetase